MVKKTHKKSDVKRKCHLVLVINWKNSLHLAIIKKEEENSN